MSTEVVEIDELQRRDMGGLEDDWTGDTCLEGFGPSGGAKAPWISGLESLEPELRDGSNEVIASADTELQELGGHHTTNHMETGVISPVLTTTGPVKAGEGLLGAGLEFRADDIALLHPR